MIDISFTPYLLANWAIFFLVGGFCWATGSIVANRLFSGVFVKQSPNDG